MVCDLLSSCVKVATLQWYSPDRSVVGWARRRTCLTLLPMVVFLAWCLTLMLELSMLSLSWGSLPVLGTHCRRGFLNQRRDKSDQPLPRRGPITNH